MIESLVCLGFSEEAVDILYVIQGIDDLDRLALLTDSKSETLLKIIHHPGGNVVSLRAGVTGESSTIPAVN